MTTSIEHYNFKKAENLSALVIEYERQSRSIRNNRIAERNKCLSLMKDDAIQDITASGIAPDFFWVAMYSYEKPVAGRLRRFYDAMEYYNKLHRFDRVAQRDYEN